jgi:NodT family efflux transporter outer membrane factor (OMF) lipoprotein
MLYLRVAIGVLASSFLMSCTALHTPYQPVQLNTPPAWQNQRIAGNNQAISQDQWWRNFNDPQLNELIDLAFASNADLAAAAIRLRQAQLQAGLTAINPAVSAAGSVNNNEQRNVRGSPNSVTTRSQSLTGTVSYEVDLWGKLASQRNAADWEVKATAEDRDSVSLVLIGTVAAQYWRIANLHQRIAASEESIRYVQKILELVRLQYDAGAVSSLEILEAERSLSSQRRAHTQLLQTLDQARIAFALLFDGPPEKRYPERQALSADALPAVDAGLPAQLLGRRPDLRAAELRLRSTLANVDIARTSFYPTWTLTGALGSTSTALSNFLKNPIATLGSSLALPFLEWHQVPLRVNVSKANYEAAVISFRQVFYKALGDVENALAARDQLLLQARMLREELSKSARIENLYRERYQAGAEPLRVWLNAQESLRAAKMAVADAELDLLIAQVTLYQALGGASDSRSMQ